MAALGHTGRDHGGNLSVLRLGERVPRESEVVSIQAALAEEEGQHA